MLNEERILRINNYREKSVLADEYAASGKIDETLNLLQECQRLASAAGDEDYRLYFDAEIINYTNANLTTQISLIEKALAWCNEQQYPPDYFIIRTKGVYLSKLGDEKAAIEFYNQALAIKPNDYQSLRNKGVSLSELGDNKAAIESYNQALAIKPDDYHSLRNKGVSLSKLGDNKAAIESYNQALAIKPDDYDSLRNKGGSLSELGDNKAAIESYNQALAIKPDDYHSLRNKGVALSKLSDEKAAIEFYDQAMVIKPDDYQSLRNKGISLSKLGDNKAAIDFFNQALAIKPDDYHSLREKGTSLSKLGNEKVANEFYNQALAIKPDDYHSLRNKGVALNNLGNAKAAIEFYNQALAIKPDDYYSLREWAVAAFNSKDPETAQQKIRQAVRLAPDKVEDDFRLIMRLTGKNPDDEWNAIFNTAENKHAESIDRLSEIRGFVGTIREGLGKIGQDFLKQKEAAESKEKLFLSHESDLAADRSFFLTLRKWNSYTPAIPADDGERSRGGGYFIYHKGRGTVIDPGYNFIENFHDAGCRIHDIDNIVMTHAHNDHTIDFESICTLLHQYNRNGHKAPGHQPKKIRLYLNNGAFKKFSGLLNLMDHNFEKIYTLNADNHYQIMTGMDLTVLPAFHDEVVAREQSIGLLFTFDTSNGTRKIVFTGDTGLFPLCTDEDELKPDTKGNELWESYPQTALEKPDLLVVHIGSIKKEELEADPSQGIDKCLYPNHLGMIGTARMITKLKPTLALVSEFGEEMRQFRRTLVERMEEDVIKKALKEPWPRVVPGDLAFIYDITEGQFFCCAGNQWADVGKIVCDYDDDSKKEDIYYFDKDVLDKVGKSAYAQKIDAFKDKRRNKKDMYFLNRSDGNK